LKSIVEKVENIEKEILSKVDLESIETFLDNMREVNRIFGKLKKIKKEDDSINKTKICEYIDIKPKDLAVCKSIAVASGVDESLVAYFTNTVLEEEQSVTKLGGICFSGIKFINHKNYWVRQELIIKGEIKTYSPTSLLIETEDKIKYLILQNLMTGFQTTPCQLWILAHQDNLNLALKHFENLAKKHNPLKNNLVLVENNSLKIYDIKPKFNINDIVISNNIRKECNSICGVIKNYKQFKKDNIPIKRGILLSGIPGIGKTTTTNAIVDEVLKIGATVFKISVSRNNQIPTPGQPYPIERGFNLAKNYEPCVVLIEDFDLIAGDRDTSRNPIDNYILDKMGDSNENTILLLTTNVIEQLDKAAIRPGRIDKIYTIDYPTLTMKKKLIEIHKKYYNIEYFNVERAFEPIIKNNLTGSAIESIILSAVQSAKCENREVNFQDFESAIEGLHFSNYEKDVI